jgi:hypothetical protein
MVIQLDFSNLNAITDCNEALNQKLLLAFLDELHAFQLFFEREEYKVVELFSARYHKLLPSLEMFGLQEYASTLSELKEKIMETGWSDGYAVLKDQCYQYLIEIKEQALQHQFN